MSGEFKEEIQKSALEAALKALEAKAATLVCPSMEKALNLR